MKRTANREDKRRRGRKAKPHIQRRTNRERRRKKIEIQNTKRYNRQTQRIGKIRVGQKRRENIDIIKTQRDIQTRGKGEGGKEEKTRIQKQRPRNSRKEKENKRKRIDRHTETKKRDN